MFKSILFRLAQGILIIALVYAGSFVFIEESAEKTEKTEKSEEALHRGYYSNTTKRSVSKQPKNYNKYSAAAVKWREIPLVEREVFSDFNVNYIYTISFLDQSFRKKPNRQTT